MEGVGDEVTQFFLALVLVLLALAAWWSTQIADTPLVRTVLILERRTRSSQRHGSPQRRRLRLMARDSSELQPLLPEPPQEPTDTGQQQQQSTSEPSAESTEEAASKREEVAEPTPAAAASTEDEGPECQLRRRRLAFLENMTSPTRTSATPETPQQDQEQDDEEEEEEEEAEVVTGPGSIRIRLKYLNDEQKLVEGRLQEPLGDFRRRHFSLELAANKLVRLIFNGQVLARDGASLEEHGLFDNCVVHCLVHQPRSSSTEHSQQMQQNSQSQQTGQQLPTQQQQPPQNREWDLGSLVFLFLSVMLGLAWYGRCVYSQYFTTTASVALVGLTGVFVVSVVGLMLPDQDGLRQ